MSSQFSFCLGGVLKFFSLKVFSTGFVEGRYSQRCKVQEAGRQCLDKSVTLLGLWP